MLWIGYLAVLAFVVSPSAKARGEHAPNLGPLLKGIKPFRWLGPLVLATGLLLIPATGRSFAALVEPGWGHAILGGLVLALVMMGIEHGFALPRLRKAHQGPSEDREDHLTAAFRGSLAALSLGLLATFLMVLALLGGF